VFVGVLVGVGVNVEVGVGETKQGFGVIVGVGVLVGVSVLVGVGVDVLVGVGVGLGTCNILGQELLSTKIVYEPKTSLGGFNKDPSNVYGNDTLPKLIVVLSLSGLNNIVANSPS
jgi:hypothetical protein